jgi:hypothetical protein
MPLLPGNALQTVRSGIKYWEQPGFSAVFARDGTSVIRRLACEWGDQQQFISDMVGEARIVGGAGTTGALLRRDLPEVFPGYDQGDDQAWTFWATDVRFIEGQGWPGRDKNGSGALAYHSTDLTNIRAPSDMTEDDPFQRGMDNQGLAVYEVTYRPRLDLLLSDEDADDSGIGELSRFNYLTYEAGGENLTYPRGLLKFEGGRLFPNAILTLHWLMVPPAGFRQQTVLGYWDGTQLQHGVMGCVNNATFLGFPAESLLCLPPQITKFVHPSTSVYIDLAYPLQFRPQTHNRFMYGKAQSLIELFKRLIFINITPTRGVFDTADFTALVDVSKP